MLTVKADAARERVSDLTAATIDVLKAGEVRSLLSFMHYDLGFFDHQSSRVECAPNPFDAKVLPMSSV